jgi:alkylated DNA repair dioxygenase AlkB
MDLFSSNVGPRRVEIEDAEILYWPQLPLPEPDSVLLNRLIGEVPWREEQILVWGRRHVQPRLVAWYGDAGSNYTYSGIRLSPLPWTDLLSKVRSSVEVIADVLFNSVLLNYYRNERDGMGFHSDDEPELGKRPVIASVSLGEERAFVLMHKTRRDLLPVRLQLVSGSLLLMKGETQRHWKHGIDKQARRCGPRVNLTFRRILQAAASQ